jgi:Family of unknown function (DUF6998)
MSIHQLLRLIAKLYGTVHELESIEEFKGRPFTPDGHLVGSIGEVVAVYVYGVELVRCSTPVFDGTIQRDGSERTVEIKPTGRNSINVSEQKDGKYADYLIALRLDRREGFSEVYVGRFPEDLVKSRKMNTRGFVSISVKSLEKRNPSELPDGGRLFELNSLFPKPKL